MPITTPFATSKTAALSRVLDLIPRGYSHYTAGRVAAGKLLPLARKFHELYGIGCTPAQRITRRKHGLANALLVLYAPGDLQAPGLLVDWLLLVTPGEGAVWEKEQLLPVTDRKHLVWLGYELVRVAKRGRTSWTWRRTKAEMADLYGLLDEQLKRQQHPAVQETLARIARQPGFAGVRAQSKALCRHAVQRGYRGEVPPLFYVQKLPHGEPLALA